MDLSTIEGLTLTPEQVNAINAAAQADVDAATTGLVNKNNELLGEKKTALQSVTDQSEALDKARLAATKAEEERLKLAGDVDGLKNHYEEQLATATALANSEAEKAKDSLTNFHKGNALNDVLSLIHDDYKGLAKAQLSNMLKIGYNNEGKVITTFESEGKVIANNVDEFKSWASEQPAFKKILNGVDSSGADTKPSRGSASITDNNPEAARKANITARLNNAGIQTKQ